MLVQVNRTIPLSQMEIRLAQFKTINGMYMIGADGYLNLGPEYGKVLVADCRWKSFSSESTPHLRQVLTNPQVLVTLPAPQNKQFIAGPHLVRPDKGRSRYLRQCVCHRTDAAEARTQIEQHLSQYIIAPKTR